MELAESFVFVDFGIGLELTGAEITAFSRKICVRLGRRALSARFRIYCWFDI